MRCDKSTSAGDQLVIIDTRPVYLRWLSYHLKHLSIFRRAALYGGLQLNSENDQLWVQVFTAVREVGLHKEYERVAWPNEDVPKWLNSASIDDISLQSAPSKLVLNIQRRHTPLVKVPLIVQSARGSEPCCCSAPSLVYRITCLSEIGTYPDCIQVGYYRTTMLLHIYFLP